jgi:hypothetical protein
MRVFIASEPAPGRRNEDFVAATTHAAVLLDGAGLFGIDDGGCRHGVDWYVRQVGTRLLTRITDLANSGLPDLLTQAIAAVADLHRDTCDLSHPGTPSATVVAIRCRDDVLDYLVLADSVLVLDKTDGIKTICDDRQTTIGRRHRSALDAHPNGSAAHRDELQRFVTVMRSYRNRAGGFWVAASDPAAAQQAITGTVAFDQLRSAMLLSDGASRLVDRFSVHTWPQVLSLVADTGPQAVIDAVRTAERSDPDGHRWPRGKTHDDASIIYSDHLQKVYPT